MTPTAEIILAAFVIINRCTAFDLDVDALHCVESRQDPLQEDAIVFNYTVLPDEDLTWRLHYAMTWEPPMGQSIIYLADVILEARDQPLTPWDFTNCREALHAADNSSGEGLFLSSEFVVELPFTHRALFRIVYGIFDSGVFAPLPVSKATNVEFETPDCYASTSDVAFCASQDVVSSGEPRDITLVAVRRINDSIVPRFQWSPPVQINQMAVISEYEVHIHDENGSLAMNDTVPAQDRVTWIAVSRDEPGVIEEEGSYVLTVIPFVSYIDDVNSLVPGRSSKYNFVASVTPDTTPVYIVTSDDEMTTMDYGRFTSRNAPPEGLSTEQGSSGLPGASNIAVTIVSVILAVVILVLLLVVLIVLRKRRESESAKVEQSYFKSNTEMEKKKPDPILESREIQSDQVTLEKKLGEGEFGVVFQGVVVGLCSNPEGITAAVKTTKDGASQELKEDLIDEMKLVAELGDHANILNLIACCSTSEPYYLITTFMEYGDLLGFLRKCREKKTKGKNSVYDVGEPQQLSIAHDIAEGMAHIQKMRFYHGDLAARNVLVGEGLSIKVSDFGLADDIYTRGYKRRAAEQKIPIKWCSLETLVNGICSTQGDVWSFGVLLYEIFTLGGTPYPGIAPVYLITQLKQGHRMEQPSSCPDDVYRLMRCCWEEDPDLRPRFTEISQNLGEMKSERENVPGDEESEDDPGGMDPHCGSEMKDGFLHPPPSLHRIFYHHWWDHVSNVRVLEEVGMTGGGIRESPEDIISGEDYVNYRTEEDLAPINDYQNDINVEELQAALKDDPESRYLIVE